MNDLIERQAAIDALDGEIEVIGQANAKAVLKYTQMVSDRIKALPSAQPEIIRCKDCKHWHEDVANNFTSIPRGGCKLVRGLTNGEFFCALGERKEINSR